MLKTFDKLYLIEAPKLFVLMILIILSCLISASAQNLTTIEIVELLKINALQLDIKGDEHSDNENLTNWMLLEGNATLVAQGGIGNLALIEQVRGVGNVAKVLQQGNNNWVGYECADKMKYGIYQLGCRNYIEVEQFGCHNISEMFQYGIGNEINIVQHGGSEFIIDNKDSSNKSIVLQVGYGNSATVIQMFYP